MTSYIEQSADVDDTATIGAGTRVWHLAQVRENAHIGANCTVSRGAYVGPAVVVGDGSKIQNYALVYDPAVLGRGVFIGPAAVLTNDQHPRAVNADLTPRDCADWHPVGVTVGEGAAIGAQAVCVAPVQIGRWASVAAGAVVTTDVPDFALVLGVPAQQVGWVGHAGVRLVNHGEMWHCPESGRTYVETENGLVELGSLPAEAKS